MGVCIAAADLALVLGRDGDGGRLGCQCGDVSLERVRADVFHGEPPADPLQHGQRLRRLCQGNGWRVADRAAQGLGFRKDRSRRICPGNVRGVPADDGGRVGAGADGLRLAGDRLRVVVSGFGSRVHRGGGEIYGGTPGLRIQWLGRGVRVPVFRLGGSVRRGVSVHGTLGCALAVAGGGVGLALLRGAPSEQPARCGGRPCQWEKYAGFAHVAAWGLGVSMRTDRGGHRAAVGVHGGHVPDDAVVFAYGIVFDQYPADGADKTPGGGR